MLRDRVPLPLWHLLISLFGLVIVISQVTIAGAGTTPKFNSPSAESIDQRNMELVDQIGGVSLAVAIQDGYAYLGEGARMRILDVSDPSNPVLISSTPPLPDAVHAIAIQEDLAYVGLGDAGLRIFDIADPATPREIGRWDEGWPIRHLGVDGDTAYVLYGGLGILDISDPAAPQVLGFHPAAAYDMVVADGTIYLATQDGLQILNTADPEQPQLVGQLDVVGETEHLALNGTQVTLATHLFECGYFECYEFNELVVVDASDKTHPQRLGGLELKTSVSDLTSDGRLAVTTTGGHIEVFDLSDAALPVHVGELNIPGAAPFQIVLSDSLVYLANYDAGLRLISLADPGAPVEIGTYDMTISPVCMALSGDHAYVANANAGLKVLSITTPTDLNLTGEVDVAGYTSDVVVAQGIAYAVDRFYGLRLIDVSDPTQPIEIGSISTPGGADAVAVMGNYAYVASRNESLHVVDVADPFAPVEVGWLSVPGWTHSMVVSGNILYLANDSAGLRLMELFVPMQPREISLLDTPGSALDVAVAGRFAYLADASEGLRIIDVGDPSTPVEVGSETSLGAAVAVAVNESFAYVADLRGGVHVFDVSNATKPVGAGYFGGDGVDVRGVAINQDVVYALDGSLGIWVLGHYGPYTITGKVLSDGLPLSGVWVSAGARHAVTGHDGGYRLTRLQEGAYNVTARRAGYSLTPSTIEVTVPPDSTQVDFAATAWDQVLSSHLPVVALSESR